MTPVAAGAADAHIPGALGSNLSSKQAHQSHYDIVPQGPTTYIGLTLTFHRQADDCHIFATVYKKQSAFD